MPVPGKPEEGGGAAPRRFFATRLRSIGAGAAAVGVAALVYLVVDDIASRRRTIEAERVASRLSDAEPGTEQYEKDTRTGRYDFRRIRALFDICREEVRRELGRAVVVRFGEGDNYPYVTTFKGRRIVYFADKEVSQEGVQLLEVPIEGQYEVGGNVVWQRSAGASHEYSYYRCAVLARRGGFTVQGVSLSPT